MHSDYNQEIIIELGTKMNNLFHQEHFYSPDSNMRGI